MSEPSVVAIVILLVEDNRGDVFLVQSALAEHNIPHQLHTVRDGEQAIRYLEELAAVKDSPLWPDLIVLDLNLPRKSGQEVLARIRGFERFKTTRVIAMSSSAAAEDKHEVSSLGAHAYFTKPSNLDDFMTLGQLIKDVLGPEQNI
jgi:two-component system, chemotaxis family, response regulator Rcp1